MSDRMTIVPTMTQLSSSTLASIRDAALDHNPVVGGIHDFYRYPARFSPGFVRAAIENFTRPGDLVLDGFVGGGTTVVEAQSLGRPSIGFDINPLAIFVSRAKTTLYSRQALREVDAWRGSISKKLHARLHAHIDESWQEAGYFRNFTGTETWALRKLIAQAISELEALSEKPRRFARCGLLRSAQWALDLRDETPTADEFRRHLQVNLSKMVEAARDYRAMVLRVEPEPKERARLQPILIESAADLVTSSLALRRRASPKLVLTSPPYPGVYVLYHRWKIHARKETPLPYWIADSQDGRGLSHYILGPRLEPNLTQYFNNLETSFKALAEVSNEDTWFAQVVGFNEPEWQLPRYLGALEAAGLEEVTFDETATGDDGRLWRDVPGRRWFATHQSATDNTSREVVLFHRLRR